MNDSIRRFRSVAFYLAVGVVCGVVLNVARQAHGPHATIVPVTYSGGGTDSLQPLSDILEMAPAGTLIDVRIEVDGHLHVTFISEDGSFLGCVQFPFVVSRRTVGGAAS